MLSRRGRKRRRKPGSATKRISTRARSAASPILNRNPFFPSCDHLGHAALVARDDGHAGLERLVDRDRRVLPPEARDDEDVHLREDAPDVLVLVAPEEPHPRVRDARLERLDEVREELGDAVDPALDRMRRPAG